MKSENPDVKLIFAEALRLSVPAERAAYLDQACADKPALRQDIESLLVAHAQAGDFLNETQPLPAPGYLVERTGTMVGRYKLLEKIGEGGFGVVWMAEQEEPVRRRVALKIIKLGMDTREVVARFEAERQALALMDHSGIASVFDGGATDTGRPYFVMELVKGVPITDYCDANRLSTRERLGLFVQVCHAVQHAHQKGIIHRDLKPSNILVTVHDDRPVPKVIDFGVAKATQARLTERTVFTRFNQWIGTPAYMSPEQAGLGSLDVDTRSDIYSLGVLLYELLTGTTPFDTHKLMEKGYEAVMQAIREEEPPKPSTRLTTLAKAEVSAVAGQRAADPAKLNRLVRGDLDWIVMKALEKDRQRRYDTATGLAQDIQRHLDTEPILAGSPSQLYRLRKMIQRNKATVTAVGAIAMAFIVGTGISVWLFVQELRVPVMEAWQQRVRKIAQIAEQDEQESIAQTRQLLLAMAESTAARTGRPRDCKQLVDDLFAAYPRYVNLGVVDTNGRPVASARPFAIEAHQRLFGQVLETRAFAFGDLLVGSTNIKPTIVFGLPLHDGNGLVRGLVFAGLDPGLSPRLQAQLPEGATLTEINRNGKILLQFPSRKERTGHQLSEKTVLMSALRMGTGVVEGQDEEGFPAVYAFDFRRSHFYAGNIVTILAIPKQALLVRTDTRTVRRLAWLATASGVSIALGFALGWLASRPQTRAGWSAPILRRWGDRKPLL